jgi:methylenetetrahydrofolate reductase (NADPH)
MLHVFRDEIKKTGRFIVTLELVPGREAMGRSVDNVMRIAADAFDDGRVTAVSITDNPGGNPSLSPDMIGHKIFKLGMDVIVHFTCRDTNRVGMESRGLQLAMMGLKNILALNGDYSGTGFGGQGAPVFDLDSVSLQCLFGMLSDRLYSSGDPDGFFPGCAISPFKRTEGECFAQYAKLCRKFSAGARFIITQLGYDIRKFRELILMQKRMGVDLPTLGSIYVLTPGAAKIMNAGRVPGAVVTDRLLGRVLEEWKDPAKGREAAIERVARLGVVLKGIGYRGIHISGIHKKFQTVARILDRMEQIEDQWEEFAGDFDYAQKDAFYLFPDSENSNEIMFGKQGVKISMLERTRFRFMQKMHGLFFNFDSSLEPLYQKICSWLDRTSQRQALMHMVENPAKKLLLNCLRCGDCGIQHVAFQCPESGCPKHCRNGACGGSLNGRCEVFPERQCVWFRAYNRLAAGGLASKLGEDCVPPRMWELNETSSWINFHLKRDHQSASEVTGRFCLPRTCGLPK